MWPKIPGSRTWQPANMAGDNFSVTATSRGSPRIRRIRPRQTTCQMFSTDPVDVRGYTQLDETVVPVKN